MRVRTASSWRPSAKSRSRFTPSRSMTSCSWVPSTIGRGAAATPADSSSASSPTSCPSGVLPVAPVFASRGSRAAARRWADPASAVAARPASAAGSNPAGRSAWPAPGRPARSVNRLASAVARAADSGASVPPRASWFSPLPISASRPLRSPGALVNRAAIRPSSPPRAWSGVPAAAAVRPETAAKYSRVSRLAVLSPGRWAAWSARPVSAGRVVACWPIRWMVAPIIRCTGLCTICSSTRGTSAVTCRSSRAPTESGVADSASSWRPPMSMVNWPVELRALITPWSSWPWAKGACC